MCGAYLLYGVGGPLDTPHRVVVCNGLELALHVPVIYCTEMLLICRDILQISSIIFWSFSILVISPIIGLRCPEASRKLKVPRLRYSGPGWW